MKTFIGVRAMMDEVFGEENFVALITFRKKTMPLRSDFAERVSDYLVWYTKNKENAKISTHFLQKDLPKARVNGRASILRDGRRYKLSSEELEDHSRLPAEAAVYQPISLLPAQYRKNQDFPFDFEGKDWPPPKSNSWKTDLRGMKRLLLANRLHPSGTTLRYVLRHDDYPVGRITNLWADASGATQQTYVVQTNIDVVKRCVLMTTDPGDLVLDPTCGSGTTAYVAEQWGRRWITIDTSRVAVALARSRLMGARYPYYLLADSPEGQSKEGEVTRMPPKSTPTHGDLRLGFVYERVPHITLRSIADNTEIDVIWEKAQETLEPLRAKLNSAMDQNWQEWEIPREVNARWPAGRKDLLAKWWEARIARQKEIDSSIAAKAEFEYLYDKPYVDNSRIRVAGPFTVESLSPHRTLAVDWDDELIDTLEAAEGKPKPDGVGRDEAIADFAQMILENLKVAGVQQAHKEDRITFTSLAGWPGHYICAVGEFMEGDKPKARRHARRPGVRHRLSPRSRRRRARGRRRRLRCADRLRLQLRRPFRRFRQARPRAGAEGPHEPRPAHGRRS